jgi:hypothetical protein
MRSRLEQELKRMLQKKTASATLNPSSLSDASANHSLSNSGRSPGSPVAGTKDDTAVNQHAYSSHSPPLSATQPLPVNLLSPHAPAAAAATAPESEDNKDFDPYTDIEPLLTGKILTTSKRDLLQLENSYFSHWVNLLEEENKQLAKLQEFSSLDNAAREVGPLACSLAW